MRGLGVLVDKSFSCFFRRLSFEVHKCEFRLQFGFLNFLFRFFEGIFQRGLSSGDFRSFPEVARGRSRRRRAHG